MSRFYPTGKVNLTPAVQPKLIDQVLEQVEHLPTLPQVVMTVLQMAESPNLNTAKLSQALDQSLAAKVLKMANSAFYGGGRARKVNTIPHAIVIIGLETLKEIVLTASLFHTFHDQQDIQKLQPLWQHSLEAAQIAKRLAWIFRYSSLDEAYFSGLIHDLGKLIIQQHFPQQYEEIEDQKNNGLEDQDAEKQVLDQFIVNGGKTLWLVDQVNMEMDSLYNVSGATLAFPRDLNLNDMFFKYGIRINPDLVKDEQGSPIKLATGDPGSAAQFQEFNWKFAPQVYPTSTHPIVKNLGGIKFDFANPIDTLKNGIKKTVLNFIPFLASGFSS